MASLNNMSFENIKYQLTIDKATFDIKNIVMDMTLAMVMEDVKMKIDQKSTSHTMNLIQFYNYHPTRSVK